MCNQSCILIIDDEPTVRKTLAAQLFKEGYNLKSVSSGTEALAQLKKFHPDVILSDVMMPDMNGFELCQHLKSSPQWKYIPVVLITALDSREDIKRGLEVGADEFLTKPVDGFALRARVRSMLRIKQQYDDLARMLQLREDLADMVTHDMRTPLTSIIGYSELMLHSKTLTDRDAESVRYIHEQSLRLATFINDLLLLAKMEHDQLILNYSDTDIAQLIQSVREDHDILAESMSISLNVIIPQEGICQLSLDTNLIRRLLDNLLSNALKFSGPGTSVTLKADYLDNTLDASEVKLRVQVMDQGPGILPEDRQRIFDKFGVASSSNTKVSQIGIGLAFCKLIAETHGGRIWVEDNTPKGSIFILEI